MTGIAKLFRIVALPGVIEQVKREPCGGEWCEGNGTAHHPL